MLPSVAGLVVRRCAPAGKLVLNLPQQLALQFTAVAARAMARIKLLAFQHRLGVLGVGKVPARRRLWAQCERRRDGARGQYRNHRAAEQ